jgi:hypothetical protein
MTYTFPATIRSCVYAALLFISMTALTISPAKSETLELICHDRNGHTRLLTAHTDAMLIYNPSRPQEIYLLDTSKTVYLDLLTFENTAWTFIYDRDREIGTLYQRLIGDFYICGQRHPV